MATIFSKIISGEISSFKIAENESFLGFLDIQPLALGHTLIIPKKETDYIFDMESEEYIEMWKFAQVVAKKIKAKIDCKRIGVAVVGLEVAHAHIHLVPINNVNDINFASPKMDVSMEVLKETADKINS
ncbi:HIT family protein [Vicingaceae bacterium]|nr:HIT family protein [Vicingaceae bacterium]MDC1450847.1 HIT family protein [Vicingaceae bacterium]